MATPKIVWGDLLDQTWVFPGPVDRPKPHATSIGATSESIPRNRDHWEDRVDHELELEVRMIPRQTVGGATGYSTANGVYAALVWLSKGGNRAKYFPDKDGAGFHNVEAIDLDPKKAAQLERGGVRWRVGLLLWDVDNSQFVEY